jgi:hypothetical protein
VPVHLIMTSTVTVLITAAMVLLFELQYPFRSNLAIGASDWSAVIQHIHVMQAGSQPGMRIGDQPPSDRRFCRFFGQINEHRTSRWVTRGAVARAVIIR